MRHMGNVEQRKRVRGNYRYEAPAHSFRRLKYSTKVRRARIKWYKKREKSGFTYGR